MLCTCILASRCCCKWSLRTGVIAITIVTLVVSLIWMAVNIWDIKSVLDSGEKGGVKKIILPCIVVALISLWAISALIMAVALCFGKRRLLIPWLIMTTVMGVIDVIVLIVAIVQISEAENKTSKAAINAIIVSSLEVVVMLFFAYCFIIVISYYFYNMREPKEWDEGYGRTRKPVYTGTDKPSQPAEPAEPAQPLNPETVERLDQVEPEEHVRF